MVDWEGKNPIYVFSKKCNYHLTNTEHFLCTRSLEAERPANSAESSNKSKCLDHREGSITPSHRPFNLVYNYHSHSHLLSTLNNEKAPVQLASPACLHLSHFGVALWLALKNKYKAKGLFNTKYYVQQTPLPVTHLQPEDKAPRDWWATGWALGQSRASDMASTLTHPSEEAVVGGLYIQR